MTELKADFRLGLRVHEIDDALPLSDVLVVPHARTSGANAALRRHAGHLGEEQAGAAHRAFAQVHEMEVVGRAVDRGIHGHR